MRIKNGQKITGIMAAGLTLIGGITAQAVTYTWDNGAGDNIFTNPVNWVDDLLPTNAARNRMSINLAGDDKAILSGGEIFKFSPLAVGETAEGEFLQTGGNLDATFHQNDPTLVGAGGFTGRATLNGGTFRANTIRVGRSAGSVGYLTIDGTSVTLTKTKGTDTSSLEIGDIGTGTFSISSGALNARGNIFVGGNGSFEVVGAGTVQILAGSASTGRWTQRPNGLLKLQIAPDGLSPITIGNNGTATFDEGSLLEVSFIGSPETNSWMVMTTDNPIVDNGLSLAPGVDPEWSMLLKNSDKELWVAYAGGGDVSYVTNQFVDAVVPMPDTWNLWNPEGTSSLSAESSSGFTALFHETTNPPPGYQPVVAQEFSSVRDLSMVGQSVTVNFDVVLLNPHGTADTGNDFRMAFYDTGLNASWFWGIDFGAPGGTVSRMLPYISSDTNQFTAGDYALLGLGYNSLSSVQSGKPDFGLNLAGITNYIEMTLSRISTNEVELSGIWTDTGSSTGTISCVFNELAPEYPQWAPTPNGKWDRVDGFGIMIYDQAPFAPLSEGSFQVSNFEVTSLTQLPEGWGYSVSEIAVESSGDITLTLSDPIVGATYNVNGTTDLVHGVPGAVGTYVAVEPGVIFIPAADAGLNTFFDVALPVTEVIE